MNRHYCQTRREQMPFTRARRWWSLPAAFVATLLALPVNAGITLPDEPLTTGNRVAPNILFILDDSGSMAWGNMNSQDITAVTGTGFNSTPDQNGISTGTGITTESTAVGAMYIQNYVTNTLYYNPSIDYLPWIDASGNRLTGGTNYTQAYSSDTVVTHAGAGTNGGSKNLSQLKQTFYAPRDLSYTTTAQLSSIANYYRFQILPGNRGIQRSVWGAVTSSNSQTLQISGSNAVTGSLGNGNSVDNSTASVAAGQGIGITISNTTTTNNRALNYEVRNPDGYVVCSGSVASNSSTICRAYTDAGQYEITVWRATNNTTTYSLTATRYTTNSCDGAISGNSWINCTAATPVIPNPNQVGGTRQRSVNDEKTNFATWYSYHRTRTKAAKAGASEAFTPLGNKVRVGYRTIWDRNNFDIPVNDGNDGRFVNNVANPLITGSVNTTSRTTWFNRLFAATASNGTPLQAALDSAGQYFSNSSATGPYGPQTDVSQYSCRQNFAILTTDGYWNTNVVTSGNSDGSNGSVINGPRGISYQYTASAPYQDGYSNTLADVAMRYWKSDLRSDLVNNVPTTDANPAFWQHMVTFGISIGLKTTRGWSSVEDVPANPSWPDPNTANPGSDNANRIDDLLHAAVNGRGTFVAASSPGEFTAGLSLALAAIAQRTSSYSNVATNSTSLSTGAKVFSASYTSGIWTGVMAAQPVDRNGVAGAVSWTASIPAFATRRDKVFTWNGTGGATFPTLTQQNALDRSSVGPVDYPVTGLDNANYLKGDRSKEGTNLGQLRVRTSLLGDIVGSSPAYVKDTDTVYVGANDGMLHAFNAANGQELFAYVPNLVNFNQLATLSRGDYTHKFFVDGPIAVTSRLMTPGKNILVGSLGRGGKGLYALDVTSPAAFAAGNVKWERGETTGQNMGQVLGAPILAQVRNGTPTGAVVLGNGPNSQNERAVLVVLNIETGAVIREIDTGAGSASLPNGLSAPTAVYAADGKTVVYVYAGDLQGNVWKFDLRSTSPAAWTATRLFTAVKGGVAQPITGGLAVATDPLTGKRWVFFGTGRFLTTGDVDDRSVNAQSIYGVMDEGVAYARANLTARTIAVTSATANGYPVRAFEAKSALPSTSKGWYVDLPGAGERVVQDAQLASSFLITASMIPEGDACEGSGTGYINALDAFTGTSGGNSFFDLNKDGTTDDTAVTGGLPVGSANMGVGMPTRPVLLPGQFVLGGSGDGSAAGLSGGRSFGMQWQRVSWREIRQD